MRNNTLFKNYTYIEYNFKLHKYQEDLSKEKIHDIIKKIKN